MEHDLTTCPDEDLITGDFVISSFSLHASWVLRIIFFSFFSLLRVTINFGQCLLNT